MHVQRTTQLATYPDLVSTPPKCGCLLAMLDRCFFNDQDFFILRMVRFKKGLQPLHHRPVILSFKIDNGIFINKIQ